MGITFKVFLHGNVSKLRFLEFISSETEADLCLQRCNLAVILFFNQLDFWILSNTHTKNSSLSSLLCSQPQHTSADIQLNFIFLCYNLSVLSSLSFGEKIPHGKTSLNKTEKCIVLILRNVWS